MAFSRLPYATFFPFRPPYIKMAKMLTPPPYTKMAKILTPYIKTGQNFDPLLQNWPKFSQKLPNFGQKWSEFGQNFNPPPSIQKGKYLTPPPPLYKEIQKSPLPLQQNFSQSYKKLPQPSPPYTQQNDIFETPLYENGIYMHYFMTPCRLLRNIRSTN